jgi:hypothetical protein
MNIFALVISPRLLFLTFTPFLAARVVHFDFGILFWMRQNP